MTICSEILNRKYTDNKSKPLTHITTSTACFSHFAWLLFCMCLQAAKVHIRNTENGLWSNTYSKARPLLLYSIVESVIGLLPRFMRSSHILQPSSWYHPTNILSAVKLNRLLHYFVVHTTCTLSVHWTIPHCLSSLSTILWCFIMQSAYITIWNTSLRAQISFFQLYQLLFLSSVSTSADAGY